MFKRNNKKKTVSAFRSILSDPKQYLSFFAALLIIQTMFWIVLMSFGINNKHADTELKKEYRYHFTIDGISETSYANLENLESIAEIDSRLLWPEIEYLGFLSDGFGTRSYRVGIILDESDPVESNKDFWHTIREHRLNISESNAEYTPLYTENPITRSQNRGNYIKISVISALISLIAFVFLCKSKAAQADENSYCVSSSKANGYIIINRICFSLTVIAALISFVFLMLTLSIGRGAPYFFLCIGLFAVSVLFLTELFSTKVNHYKFRYGIYMTFGANLKKLYSTAVKEMLTVSASTLIPSLLIASGISLIIYKPLGVDFFVPVGAVIGVIMLTFLISVAATYIPIKRMSLKLPATLLGAEDNSNMVSSPRRSANVLKKSFPSSYEFLGMWRFRKYFLRLTATAVAFSTVFVCGLYVAHVTKKREAQDVHEFELISSGTYDMTDQKFKYISYELENSEALKYFFWKDHTYASSIKAHALINEDNTVSSKNVYNIETKSSDRKEISAKRYSKTTDSFEFVAYSEILLDSITDNGIYNVEGDIYSIIGNNDTIIVSEYISNVLNFDFEVGDSVFIAIPGEKSVNYDEKLIKGGKKEEALKQMIAASDFTYKEYKIGAIIDYGGGDDHFIIGMNISAYTETIKAAVPDADPTFMTNILVYAKEGLTPEELYTFEDQLKNAFSDYGYKITETYGLMSSKLERSAGNHAIILTVSFIIMFISPLIWFFSQLRFYTRRSKETFVLRALGVTERKMARLYVVSGVILALISAVMTLAMSYIFDYIIYLICTRLIPSMSSVSGITVTFYMPPTALVICVVTSVVCGFLSSYLPYALKRFVQSKSDRYTIDGQ